MIRTLIFRTLIALLPLLVSLPASARDIFVNNEKGDDIRDGTFAEVDGARGGPCRSIARALRLVQPGDRVVLAKTTTPYRESITLQASPHSGSPQKPFELVGNGAILDGTQEVPKDRWEHVGGELFRFQPPRTSYQMLFLGGRPATRRAAVAGQGLPRLEPLEWCLYERMVYFRVEPGKLPREYELFYAHQTVGITLYEVRHVVVSDLIVQGFQLDAINSHDNVFQATLRGLTCRGNGRSGISIGGASRVTLDACTVGDNGAAQVRTEGYCRAALVNCSLLENTAPALVRQGGEVTLLEGTRIE